MGHLGLSTQVVSSQLCWKAHKQREGGSGGAAIPNGFHQLVLICKGLRGGEMEAGMHPTAAKTRQRKFPRDGTEATCKLNVE